MPQPLDRARQGAHVTTGRKFNTTIDDKTQVPIPDQTRCETCAEQHRQYPMQTKERTKDRETQASRQASSL